MSANYTNHSKWVTGDNAQENVAISIQNSLALSLEVYGSRSSYKLESLK